MVSQPHFREPIQIQALDNTEYSTLELNVYHPTWPSENSWEISYTDILH